MAGKEEAAACIVEAEKHLKTGFLKWKPDFELAADRYQRAAQLLRGQHAQQRDAHLKAADCFVKHGSFFSAAKQVELAALTSRDMKDFNEVANLFERASNLFVDHRSPDSAVLTLEKGAKILETSEPQWKACISFYKRAADLALLEEKNRQAADMYASAVRISLKCKNYDEALSNLNQQRQCLEADGATADASGRLVVCQILVQLARGDEVAAHKCLRDGSGWLDQEQYEIMSTLLKGFDDREPSAIVHALDHPFLKHMDTELSKVARMLRQMHATKAKAAGQSCAQETPQQEDEFEQGSLC